MSNPLPTSTPNVIIRDPKLRQITYDVFGVVGLLLAAVVAADAVSEAFNASAFTIPATAVYTVIGGGIGFLSRQNTPTP